MGTIEFIILALWVISGCLYRAAFAMGEQSVRRAEVLFILAGVTFSVAGFVWAFLGEEIPQHSLFVRLLLASAMTAFSALGVRAGFVHLKKIPPPLASGPGGAGGFAKVKGNFSSGEGGAGGEGGLGPGGKGGDVEVVGDSSFAKGGQGGNAGQQDGRGGRRTQGPTENPNYPTSTWKYGYGGRGANALEYDRRLKILTIIREEYMEAFPDDVIFIQAGIDQVPLMWVNKRLEEMQESWRATMENGCYKLPPLDPIT